MTCYCPLCDERWTPAEMAYTDAVQAHDRIMHGEKPTAVVLQ